MSLECNPGSLSPLLEQAFLVCALPLCVGETAGKDALGTLCVFINFPALIGGRHGIYMNLMHSIKFISFKMQSFML